MIVEEAYLEAPPSGFVWIPHSSLQCWRIMDPTKTSLLELEGTGIIGRLD